MASKIKTFLLVQIIFLFIINTAQAVTIDFYGADIIIQDAGTRTKLTVTFDSRIESFRLPFGREDSSLKIVKASANKGSVSCALSTDRLKTYVDCAVQNPPDGRNTAVIELESSNRPDISGGKNTMSTSFEFPFDTKSLSVSYKFPERASLSEDPPENSISPRNGDIKTDGKKMFIFWNRQNITEGDILTFSTSYTLPGQRESPINTLLILPIIIVLSAFVWLVIKHKKATKAVGEKAAVSVLSGDEKILFDILKAHEGSVGQKVLVRESNFSKAKVSRLVKELKQRGVIEIEPLSGRENRILLRLGQQTKETEKIKPAPKQEIKENREQKTEDSGHKTEDAGEPTE